MLIGMPCGAVTHPPRSAGVTDPYFSSVVSLLHFDGNLTDVKGKTWTAAGNAAANGTAIIGTNSLIVDGAGDYITTGDSADWYMAAGDWTVEFRVNFSAPGQVNYSTVLAQVTTAGDSATWINIVLPSSSYQLQFYSSSDAATWNIASAKVIGTCTQNQSHFVSVSRQGTNIYCHLDGVLGSTTAVGATAYPDYAKNMIAMGGNFASTYCTGRMDELRITKGVGRYGAANYTPTTLAFPDA